MKYPIFYCVFVLMFFWSCKKSNPDQTNENQTLNIKKNSSANENGIEVFSFPEEIQGCSCYFAKTKTEFLEEKYIYADDYGNNAYLKLNGKTIKIKMEEGDFDPQNFNKILENEEFRVTIKGEKKSELDPEALQYEGTLIIFDKKNKKNHQTTLYGECGC